MPLTVHDLLDLPGLGLAVRAGNDGLDGVIRWAHISELQDPTPWLSGGELLLTTGLDLDDSASAQRAYVQRLVAAGVAGLGFGVGFDYGAVPPALVKAADRAGLPVLEVPYPVPFIAITEAVASRLTEERVKDAQMSVEVHERLASLVVDGSGPADVLDEVVELAPGWAVLFDLRGRVVARASARGVEPPGLDEVWSGLPPGLAERSGPSTATETGPWGARVALAVSAGRRHEAVLVYGKPRRLDQRDRIVVHHAVTVLGLLLASRRAVMEAERRVAGDVLNEGFTGRLNGAGLERRLELAGFPPDALVSALVLEPPSDGDAALDDLAWTVDSALGVRTAATRATVMSGRVAALVRGGDPETLASALIDDLRAARDNGAVRIGVGEPVRPRSIRRSYLSAVFALRAAPDHKKIASPRDLGSYEFLLSAQPEPALEGYVRSVLGPLIDRDASRSSELVESVRTFIAAGGRWEQGADALGIHRHTLRYRVRQAEELLERDLSSAEDRLEIWLALKAAEMLEE